MNAPFQLFDALPAHIEDALRRQAGREGLVYFIQSADGHVKIGWAKSPSSRLREIQVGSPHRLRLVAVMRGGRQVEAALHSMLAEFRTLGEWFAPSPKVLECVRQVRLEVGVTA